MPTDIRKLIELVRKKMFGQAVAAAKAIEHDRPVLFQDYDLVRFLAGVPTPINPRLIADLVRQAEPLIAEIDQADGVPKEIPT